MQSREENPLGTYLRDRRAKLDPAALGISTSRRRTPGLRREEVAQRANVSATWYTWLEQGRGGSPSSDVLHRIADALALTPVEREHLFLLAQHRPPEVHYQPFEPVTPLLQRVLDAMEATPAVIKTAEGDIVAWNDAAIAVLSDYPRLAPHERNILHLMFCDAAFRASLPHWQDDARKVVAAFRAHVVRVGASERVRSLVSDLRRRSPEFAAMWQDYDVCNFGEGTKRVRHPFVGLVSLEYSAFTVDGRPDLSLVIYTPATPADRENVRAIIDRKAARRA